MMQCETGMTSYKSSKVVGEIGEKVGSKATNGVEIKSEERNIMPGAAKRGGSKRRATNSDGDAKTTSKLSGRKRVQQTYTCSASVTSK
jgi:hypothetical protein